MRWPGLGACLLLGLGALTPGWALAHDIPNARIDRATQVTLEPGRLRVDYEVSLADLTLAQDLRQLDPDAELGGEGGRAALFERYARVVGPLNARGFLLRVGTAEVDLALIGHELAVEDHPRFTFHLAAPIPPSGRLTLADTNYASSEGPVRLACRVASGVQALGDLPPADLAAIPLRATWQLTDREEAAARRLVCDYAQTPTEVSSGATRSSPAEPPATTAKPAPSGLTRLLDADSLGSGVAWLAVAFVLGLAHAVQPGHGKTLIAAASLDGVGTSVGRGVALGVLTAVVHLASVAVLAAALWWLDLRQYGAIQATLTRGVGFLIAVLGSFRLGRALGGAREVVAAQPSFHQDAPSAGLLPLALAAGAVPCWDAVALLVVAEAAHRLAWGLTLLIAFSLGLGAVLVAVGALAGRINQQVGTHDGQGRAYRHTRWLSGGSALILLVMGLALLLRT